MTTFLRTVPTTRFAALLTPAAITVALIAIAAPPTFAEPVRVYHKGMHITQPAAIESSVVHRGHVTNSDNQVNRKTTKTASTKVSMPAEPDNNYYLKPYQLAHGKPVRLGYYAPDAATVAVEASNDRTNKTYTHQLNVADAGVWHGQLPTTFFKAGDSIQIMFTPVDKSGLNLGSPEQVVNYKALPTNRLETSHMTDRPMRYIAQQ